LNAQHVPLLPSPLRVLIVDDSAFERRVIHLLLEQTGCFTVAGHAADGLEGLIKARELSPDLITLDLDMPRMDGAEMLRQLRAESAVPVVVVSAFPDLVRENVRVQGDSANIEFVTKTISDDALDLSIFGEELTEKLFRVWQSNSPDQIGQ